MCEALMLLPVCLPGASSPIASGAETIIRCC